VKLALGLTASRSAIIANNGVRLLTIGGLLAADLDALAHALDAAQRLYRKIPATLEVLEDVEWAMALVTGGSQPPRPSPTERDGACTRWLVGRHALDVGAQDRALAARDFHNDTPSARCATAALHAAALSDPAAWRTALALAVEHQLPLYAVDAFEHLAAAAAAEGRARDALRLFGAADRSREKSGYHWRFPSEERRVKAGRALATAAIGDAAIAHLAVGRKLSWREVAGCVPGDD
jgi:hypothetical protein